MSLADDCHEIIITFAFVCVYFILSWDMHNVFPFKRQHFDIFSVCEHVLPFVTRYKHWFTQYGDNHQVYSSLTFILKLNKLVWKIIFTFIFLPNTRVRRLDSRELLKINVWIWVKVYFLITYISSFFLYFM